MGKIQEGDYRSPNQPSVKQTWERKEQKPSRLAKYKYAPQEVYPPEWRQIISTVKALPALASLHKVFTLQG